jgi:hypothetical protein
MGVELRRGVTVHRAGGVMLELGNDELASRLGGIVTADPSLGISL